MNKSKSTTKMIITLDSKKCRWGSRHIVETKRFKGSFLKMPHAVLVEGIDFRIIG